MTGNTRLPTLDLLRGVAVLGILLLNIVAFAMPFAAYYNPRAYGGATGADLAVWLVNFILFDGKMRGLFSFLFGASMLLIAERAEAGGESAASVHYRRMAWLLVFGLAHLWLVWDGDILSHYALVGMAAFALRRLECASLIVLGTMLVLLSTFLSASFPMEVAWGSGPDHPRALQDLVAVFGVPPQADITRALELHRSGYAALVADRFRSDSGLLLNILYFVGPETLGYMCFGMAALRSGCLSGKWPRRTYQRMLRIGWGIGIPGYAGLAAMMVGQHFSLLSVTLADTASGLLRPPMIAGWIALLLLLIRPESAIGRRLAAAGRMAFSNYLLTTLICTTLFYGYGFGWFGRLSRWQLYPIVLAIWTAMLLWSTPWLARFRFGPFEWLWRSLARGRLQPMRRTSATSSH